MNKQRKFILYAAIAGVIATFLPWLSLGNWMNASIGGESYNGFHGSGILFFLLQIAIGIVARRGVRQDTLPKNMRPAVIGGGIASLLCVVFYMHNSDLMNRLMVPIIGIGYIAGFIASICEIVIPLVIKKPGESLKNDVAVLKSTLQSIQNNAKPAAPASHDRIAEMEKLVTWRSEGKITAEEFEDMKSKIL